MAVNRNEGRVTMSVFDRLIDTDPSKSQDVPKSRATSLRELKDAVRRDVEWLLNTRCFIDRENESLEETRRSVAFYGLQDFTGLAAKDISERKRITTALEESLRFFEPRFLDLKISVEPVNNVDRQLKFRIEARLDVDPAPEPITFDTVLSVGSGEFSVKEK